METIHTYERNAQYYETDRMGVIHHSNYIRWFEEARVDYMQKAGFPYDKMEETGIMMPVLNADCEYRSSVKFGDTVVIRTAISKFNGLKVELQYTVSDKLTGELRVKGSTSHCFTDTNMKPVRIKRTHPDIYDLFNEVGETELFKKR